MTKPLTKKARAEMRERFMLGEYTPEDVQDVFERLEEADLATAKLATAEICKICRGEMLCSYCTNGVVYSDERARELLSRLELLEHENKAFSDNLTAVVAERDELKNKQAATYQCGISTATSQKRGGAPRRGKPYKTP